MTADRPLVPMPLARGARGAVVAPHHLATAAGLAILRAGGHAVDAAIATNAVLGVVMPNALRDRRRRVLADLGRRPRGRQTALNGSGRAPAGADAGRAPARRASTTLPSAARSRSRSPARSARGATPIARLRPAVARREVLGAGDRARARTASRPGTGSSTRSSGRCRRSSTALGPDAGLRAGLPARTAGRGDRASGSGCRPSPRRSSASPTTASTTSTTARSASARRRALAGARLPITRRRLPRPHLDLDRADRDDLPRRAGHDPSAELARASSPSSCSTSSSSSSRRRRRPSGRTASTTPRWVHLGIEAAKLAMADRDAHLTDPESSRSRSTRLPRQGPRRRARRR